MNSIVPANDFVLVKPKDEEMIQFRSGLSGNMFATAELERKRQGEGTVVSGGQCDTVQSGMIILYWLSRTTKITREGKDFLLIDKSDIFCRR